MSVVETTFAPGSVVEGYRVDRVEPVPYLNGTYIELTHQGTGARHIHIAVPDDNNAFVVMLPTPPNDSTGVAHILEHLALSGSERFPVKDVFFSMNPRSLRTYMNASTSADATSYYYSSRNAKDYRNLMTVYLDAVFFPRLAELSFKQEGHRLEFERGDDPDSGLRFKGVVFNEMKGAMANPVTILFRAAGRALFPDLTYAYNSGGDPKEIPNLTWENLRAFHARHYHPSNAFFYTYGNLPLEETLRQINAQVLRRFDAIEPDVEIPDQKPFPKPAELVERYPLSDHEEPHGKFQVLVCWAVVPSSDSFLVLAFEVLERVLLANAASPLRKALVDSGLGSALNDLSGYLAYAKQSVFGAGLKDVKEEDAGKVEQLILDTLTRLAEDGLDQEMVDAAIHRLELERREVSNSGSPYGLRLFDRFEAAYVHGGDPYRALMFDEDLARLQRERVAGPFLESLIRRWLVDNPHRSRILLAPDQEMVKLEEEQELAKLAQIEQSLTAEQKTTIVEEAMRLAELQDAKQDLSVLPTLELEDIPMTFEDVPHTVEQIAGATVGFFPQPTNGISYLDLRFDFSRLDDDLIDLLAPFAFAATRSGAGPYDYLQMASRIETYTGGIGAAPMIRVPLPAREADLRRTFALSGKALRRNHRHFVNILSDLLTGLSFEPSRLKDLLAQQKARLEPQVIQGGHMFAQRLALASLSDFGRLEERVNGLSVLGKLKELSALTEDQLNDVIARYDRIREALFHSGTRISVCVTAEESALPELREEVGRLLESLPGPREVDEPKRAPAPPPAHRAKTTSVPVAYNAKVRRVVGFTDPDAPALLVLANYLDDKYLLREIREKGGAYGASALFGRETGYFSFLSYRDPHIARTLKVWEEAVPFVQSADITPDDLKEAILASCAAIDPLLSPDTKGRSRFFDDLSGYTLDRKAEFKRGVLAVTVDDLRRVAAKYLSDGDYALATITNPAKIEEANAELGNLYEVSAI
ncbi:MAG TPA: insulinase family protein [Actinomycetota bacterium]|nr:insulinase family protein [Actinomycetota bacterium]